VEAVKEPYIKVEIASKDITSSMLKYLLALTYTDKVDGESDELEIEIEDSDGLWRGPWYPDKGAEIVVTIGDGMTKLKCGTFQIDEIEQTGPPDIMRIRGLAAGITQKLRTKKGKAHEKKTLKQIAEAVASDNGLTVKGTIPDVRFDRITQHRETDLKFLKRIGYEYGLLFSVRGKQLVFTTIYEIEERNGVMEIDRLDLTSYSIKDKATNTYKNAKVAYHNPVSKEVVKTDFVNNKDNVAYAQIAAGDTKMIYSKSENKQQAEQKAKAALHRANSKQQEGSIRVIGNPLLVAGNNFTLTGMGNMAGKWHISESRHTITKGQGYETECTIKRVGTQGSKSSTKKAKAAIAQARTPQAVAVQNKVNKDGVVYPILQ
jgi:phage protein D